LDQKGQDKGGEGSRGSFQWGGYFNTMYWADPQEEVIGILMKQTMEIEEDNTGWKFRQVVGQAIDD
jgi:CubicO group peptidase (beta-lactamase class C family)